MEQEQNHEHPDTNLLDEIPNLDGQLHIERSPIAGGGFANIYRGKWIDPRVLDPPQVAIKVVRPSLENVVIIFSLAVFMTDSYGAV